MLLLLSACLLLDQGSIAITCESAESCDFSDVDAAPEYHGGYNVHRCDEELSSTGHAVGEVSPDFELRDQHGDLLRLSDFCGNTVLLVGCALWSPQCFQDTLEGWYREHTEHDVTIIALIFENEDSEPPSSADLLDWAELNELTYPIVADPGAEVIMSYLSTDPSFNGGYAVPNMQILVPNMIVERVNSWITDDDLRELVD